MVTRRYISNEVVASLKDVHVQTDRSCILHGVSFDVTKGERLLITGPSGSGKSTALRVLAGIEVPTEGEAHVFGKSLGALSENKRRAHIKRRMGIGFQSPNLDASLSVLDNMTNMSFAFGRGKKAARRAGELAARLGLADKLLQPAATLSGGEKLRVSLGRLLVPEPELLILDEPTSMIDPAGKAMTYELVDSLAGSEATIIMVSHDIEAASIATRHLVIESGNVTQDVPL